MEIKTLCSLIDERKDELFGLLSDLIKINSESFSAYGNEEECARYIHKLCLDMGLDSDFTYLVSTVGKKGAVDTTSNMKIIIVTEDGAYRLKSMERY